MKYVFMDLDGTITDPKEGITKSVQYALKAFGIEVEDRETLLRFIGPPLRRSFMDYYGFSEEQAEEGIKKYREYFSVTGLYENKVYEGMEMLLTRLKQAGFHLIVATSKPEYFAEKILKHFSLDQYFTDVCGVAMGDIHGTKEDVIRDAMKRNKITDITQVVMVGDRMHDVEGAKAVGLPCIGVLYGYGSRQELSEAGADKLAETVEEVYDKVVEVLY